MKNTKKIIAFLMIAVLTITATVAGTLAYFTDTESATNVWTVGGVDIEQHELQRAEDSPYNAAEGEADLVPFEQGQALAPAYATTETAYTAKQAPDECYHWGSYVTADSSVEKGTNAWNGLWNEEELVGAMDKMVFVENTGKTDCYYRTIIAFECPEGMEYSEGSDKEFMMNVNGNRRFDWEEVGYITVDGTRYLVMEALYNEVLPAGTISRPSLLQVVMTDNVTNEDAALIGDTYEILVLSQACQTTNFPDAATALDESFGDVTVATAAEWFGADEFEIPTLVSTADELVAAVKAGKNVVLTADINFDGYFSSSSAGDINIDGNGKTLTLKGIFGTNGAKVTLSNVTLVDSNDTDYMIFNRGGKVELTNVTYSGTTNKAFEIAGGGELVLNDCNITGKVTGTYSASNIWCGDGRTVTVNGGTYGSIFMNVSEGANILSASKITVNDGTIGKLTLETEVNTETGDGTGYKSATLVQNGGTITELVENPQGYDLTGLTKLN